MAPLSPATRPPFSRRTLLSCTALVLLVAVPARGQDAQETPAEKIRKVLDQPIALEFAADNWQEVADNLKKKTGIHFVADPALPDAGNWKFKTNGVRFGDALRRFLMRHDVTFVVLEDMVVITCDTSIPFAQVVNVRADNVPLYVAMHNLNRSTPFNYVIDPRVASEAQKAVTMKADNVGLEPAVRLLAELAGLKAVRVDNTLLITSEVQAGKVRFDEKAAQDARKARSSEGPFVVPPELLRRGMSPPPIAFPGPPPYGLPPGFDGPRFSPVPVVIPTERGPGLINPPGAGPQSAPPVQREPGPF